MRVSQSNPGGTRCYEEGWERYAMDKYVRVWRFGPLLWCTCVLDKCTTTLVNCNQLTPHNSLGTPDLNVRCDKSL